MAGGVSAVTEGCFNKNRSAGWVLHDIFGGNKFGLGRGKDDIMWATSMDLRALRNSELFLPWWLVVDRQLI